MLLSAVYPVDNDGSSIRVGGLFALDHTLLPQSLELAGVSVSNYSLYANPYASSMYVILFLFTVVKCSSDYTVVGLISRQSINAIEKDFPVLHSALLAALKKEVFDVVAPHMHVFRYK